MTSREHVYVAMSGGVDSAVSAAKLIEAGYQVTGIHMTTWKDPKWEAEIESLPSPVSLAQATADFLGIPFINLDVRDPFYLKVVESFIEQYLAGQTPNPCMFCNPEVKWGLLQTYALTHGGDYFATGHYARLERSEDGTVRLLRGLDSGKDQSYVLAMLSQEQFQKTLLPLGGMTKAQVREKASQMGLQVADQQDSQDLCFLGTVHYRDFLDRYAPEAKHPGEIVNPDGKILGEHEGLAFYTIGQRKGIRIAAPEPYYVIGKDSEKNHLVVGFADQTGVGQLTAERVNWVSGQTPELDDTYDVMVRYRANPVSARMFFAENGKFKLEFMGKIRGVSPGQVAVLYKGEECLGGGVIQSAE
ncbi:tRNA 2-thiouridine(34) synthase MnmA [Chloroflexota bacterium]|nr:tRNA 2-thiouridine(34) synthase MnmA [Chloroflexota bacterium]